jgi:hypothetical protein
MTLTNTSVVEVGLASLATEANTTYSAENLTARRTLLNEKFERTGNLDLDINIRGNQATATTFFRAQGLSEADANALMTGIDFSKPVEIQAFGAKSTFGSIRHPAHLRGTGTR